MPPKVKRVIKNSSDAGKIGGVDSSAVIIDIVGDYEPGGYSSTY